MASLVDAYLRNDTVTQMAAAARAAERQLLLDIAGPEDPPAAFPVDRHAFERAFEAWASGRSLPVVDRTRLLWRRFGNFLVEQGLVSADHAPPIAAQLLRSAATEDPRGRRAWPSRDLALVALLMVSGLQLSQAIAVNLGAIVGPRGHRRLELGGSAPPTAVALGSELERLVGDYLAERAERFPHHAINDPTAPLFVHADTGLRPTRAQMDHLLERISRRAGLDGPSPAGLLGFHQPTVDRNSLRRLLGTIEPSHHATEAAELAASRSRHPSAAMRRRTGSQTAPD